MNPNAINFYLEQAREIIGDRSQGEIDYDNAVVAYLAGGKDIKTAVRSANQEHPEEAMKPDANQWQDFAARYDYIMEHKVIMKRLGMKE